MAIAYSSGYLIAIMKNYLFGNPEEQNRQILEEVQRLKQLKRVCA